MGKGNGYLQRYAGLGAIGHELNVIKYMQIHWTILLYLEKCWHPFLLKHNTKKPNNTIFFVLFAATIFLVQVILSNSFAEYAIEVETKKKTFFSGNPTIMQKQ